MQEGIQTEAQVSGRTGAGSKGSAHLPAGLRAMDCDCSRMGDITDLHLAKSMMPSLSP